MKLSVFLRIISTILGLAAFLLAAHASYDKTAYPRQLTRAEIFNSPPQLAAIPLDHEEGQLKLEDEPIFEAEIANVAEVELLPTQTSPPEEPAVSDNVEVEEEATSIRELKPEDLKIEKEIFSEDESLPDAEPKITSFTETEMFAQAEESLAVIGELIFSRETEPLSEKQGLARFSLPKVNVESEIINIPIIDGEWDLTNLHDEVGILEGAGRFPGDTYGMIFAGHVTTSWPILGPFGRLENFSLGDRVIYSDGENTYTYEITRFIYAHPSRVDLLFVEGGDQIVLVTCNGYDLLSDTFSKRLISYATLVDVKTADSAANDFLVEDFR